MPTRRRKRLNVCFKRVWKASRGLASKINFRFKEDARLLAAGFFSGAYSLEKTLRFFQRKLFLRKH
jgi:hypothetical protein